MILCYHKVALEPLTYWWVSADAFDRQMADLQGYDVVYLDDYDPSRDDQVVITFDGTYSNVAHYALPILKKWGYPFEAFVIGDWVGRENVFDQKAEPSAWFADTAELDALAEAGGRIQWHTRTHEKLAGLPSEQLAQELTPNDFLAARYGDPHLRWFAYPHGELDTHVVASVELRFAGALAVHGGAVGGRYALPRVEAAEDSNFSRSTVAVVIVNYNYGRYLAEAVESVMRQTRQPDELIIIDDGSEDGSREIVQRYKTIASVLQNEKNLGIVPTFRLGVEGTSTDYVVMLGADNRMRPDFLERTKAALDAEPDAAVAYTDVALFGPRAALLAAEVGAEATTAEDVFRWRFPDPSQEVLANLPRKNVMHGSSMYRRQDYDRAGGYRDGGGPEDHNLWIRMVTGSRTAVRVPEPVLEYRQHSGEQANTLLAAQLELQHWLGLAESRETAAHALTARVVDLESQLATSASGLESAEVRESSLVEALRRSEAETDRLREDLARVADQLGRSTQMLRREERSVARPLARRLYSSGRSLGQALPPDTQRRVRAGLAPIARALAPRSAQADAYSRAAGVQPPLGHRMHEGVSVTPTPRASALPAGRAGAVDVVILPVIDWHFRIQRPQHLATELARRGHRVIYLTTEFDRLRPGGNAYSVLERVDDLVWVVRLACPSPLPRIYRDPLAPHQVTPVVEALELMLQELGLGPALLLAQHPFWEPVLRASGRHFLGYDLIDDHAGFEGTEAWVLDAEERLLDGVDLVTATAGSLAKRAPGSVLVRNASDVERFSAVPDSLRPVGRPVIGYFGAIAHWFDVELVERCAVTYPDYEFVLIGSAHGADIEPLRGLRNVQLLGEMQYDQLPGHLETFDVCMIPFHIIPLTEHTNPVKAYEYLSAGRPVVATAMPEVRLMEPYVHVADDRTQFVKLLATAVSEVGDAALARQRREWAGQHSWAARAAQIEQAVAQRTPRVSVVVLCFNNLAFTRACLDSLDRLTGYPDWELVVVDNASTDDTADFLREWASERDQVKLVLNEDNLGFAGGNNSGLAAASGDFLVMLNNDTYVTKGWLLSLIRHLRDNPSLGLVGPVTNNIGNEAKVDLAYDDMEQMQEAARHYTSHRFRQLLRVPTVAFFCVAMSREVYEKVGGLDEAFGVGFFEDDDYCRRVKLAGFDIAIAEDVFVHHHLSASFDALGAARKQELFEKNKAIYEAKWGTWTPHVYRAGDRT